MTLNARNIMLRHNCVFIPSTNDGHDPNVGNEEALATVMMNLSHYGYALSMESYKTLTKLGPVEMVDWWMDLEPELKLVTGDDRKIGDFVVYKNFPAEVLKKTEAQYWIPQLLMYWGFPNEFFTEPVQPRAKMNEQPKATVLKMAKKDSLKNIFTSYLQSPARWKDHELQDVLFLSKNIPINMSKLAFKENLVSLAIFMMANGQKINITTATDALRLAVGLSNGDVSLREKSKFLSFKKPVRRFLLSTLEECANLTEDVARRPELWKRLFHQLHAGDYKKSYPRVIKVMDELYHDKLVTFNSKIEGMLINKDAKVLDLLVERPGDFRRRLSHVLNLFGKKAAKAFTSDEVLSKLTTVQIVTLRSFLETVNERKSRIFPPKGNWTKAQVAMAKPIDKQLVKTLSRALGVVLAKRVPKVKMLDAATTLIKLPSNDGEVSSYNRGTVFPIPDDIEFIRTASYWRIERTGNIWFDNGWNFFDADWKSMGHCCWDDVKFGNNAAVFSGDPTNSKEMQGRAAQLIDLYPAKLKAQGVRYAVWNILAFSHIPFAKADDVFAALQWGKDAQKGKLFEPSRAQLSFPLTGDSLTKYICLIDLEKREMVYLDANLYGNVHSASRNGGDLEKNMPPYMEYIKSLPSVHDLFRESVDTACDGAHILYSDKDTKLKDVSAYVFKPENKENKYKSVDLNNLL